VKYKFLCALAATAAVIASTPANAADWPTQPITLIAPVSAGGSADPVARLLAEGLNERLGQPVLVEFRPGASATIGTNLVAKAKPDGYTLLLSSSSPVVNVAYTLPALPYDVDDVVPVAQIVDSPMMIVANGQFAPNDFAEMIDYAKANPGQVNLAIQGVGGLSHFAASLIEYRTGAKFNMVAYKGAGDLQADLLSGVVNVSIGFPSSFMPGVNAGKLKFLGTFADERVETLPDVQTTEEQGFPEVKAGSWFMLFAPKGLPQEITDKLVEATNDYLKSDKAQERLEQLGFTVPVDGTPETAAALLARDRQDFKEVFESGAMDMEE